MVIVLLVAGFPVGQAALEVRTQITTSPLDGVYEKVLLFVPEFTLFTFH